jgi:hypothetical protein
MSLSPSEAAKHVGLTKQSVIKAIRSGRLSAVKDSNGGWSIEPVELFRVWPAVNQDRGRVTPEVDAGLPPENNEVVAALKGQIELLRSQLDDVRVDRNHWRQIAERSLLTDQRSASERLQQDTPQSAEIVSDTEPTAPTQLQSDGGFWSRLFGRPSKDERHG